MASLLKYWNHNSNFKTIRDNPSKERVSNITQFKVFKILIGILKGPTDLLPLRSLIPPQFQKRETILNFDTPCRFIEIFMLLASVASSAQNLIMQCKC